jgi:hypothetical protein
LALAYDGLVKEEEPHSVPKVKPGFHFGLATMGPGLGLEYHHMRPSGKRFLVGTYYDYYTPLAFGNYVDEMRTGSNSCADSRNESAFDKVLYQNINPEDIQL